MQTKRNGFYEEVNSLDFTSDKMLTTHHNNVIRNLDHQCDTENAL